MKNNKGFTLVELIVSAAIFGLVALAAAAFLITGVRSYNQVNDNLQLQYDSQLALNLINDYAVDCEKGVVWEEDAAANTKTLYLANRDSVHIFRYEVSEGRMYYIKSSLSESLDEIDKDLMAENVTDLQIRLEPTGGKTQRLELTLKMERGTKSFQATQVTALRNKPVSASTWEDLWVLIRPEEVEETTTP